MATTPKSPAVRSTIPSHVAALVSRLRPREQLYLLAQALSMAVDRTVSIDAEELAKAIDTLGRRIRFGSDSDIQRSLLALASEFAGGQK